MLKTLDRIRKKTHAERQMITLGVAGGITGIIFFVWLVSLLASIEKKDAFVEQSGAPGDFNSFLESFQEATNLIQRETGAVREQFQSITSPGEPDANAVSSEDISVVEEAAESGNTDTGNTPKSEEVEVMPSGLELIKVEDSLPQDSQPE